MTTHIFLEAIGFTAPVICALVCLMMVATDMHRQMTGYRRNLHLLLVAVYFTGALCWTGLVLYVVHREAFAWYYPLFLCAMMMDQVLIYRFVYRLTAMESKIRIQPLHYLIPTAMTVAALVICLPIPIEQKIAVIYGTENTDPQGWFTFLYGLTSIVFIVYNTLYPLLGLLRVRRFHHQAGDYFSDPERTSLNWLSIMLILTLVTVPVPLAGSLTGVNAFTDFYFTITGVLPNFVVYVILCYNLISDNYVMVEPETEGNPLQGENQINRASFENYMHRSKPYTNPNLRITDIADDLNTNRTYISAFINHEYGMNFNRFVNSYRLRELDKLRSSSAGAGLSNLELIISSGFNSYRSYLRAKNDEDKRRTVKPF